MKSGFVSIVGRPNAGKSTIINALLERKLSIVTEKAQTTRNSIKGIYDDGEYQIIFIDTPGIHKANHELGNFMNKEALDSAKDVDANILVVDASRKFDAGDEFINESLPKNIPLFIVINKIDLMRINEVQAIKAKYQEAYPHAELIEASAIENFGIDTLLNKIKEVIQEGPRYFAEDQVTDKDSNFMISEVIREKLLKLLKDEVPHDLAVRVDEIKSKSGAVYIRATIIVDKESHKGIVIGKGGKRIKAIGMKARTDLEEYYNKRIFLELFVSVKEDWLNNPRILKELGYK
ncbi:MAG: GTPase Era [Firmicutes bacterium]|nr:GTPase Era [Candidatus Fiminaster equi]